MYYLPSTPVPYYNYQHPYVPYRAQQYYHYDPSYYYQHMPYWFLQRDAILGKANWTWGGMPTKCEIPWKTNNHMTVAVGEKSPFKCGQKLKVKNISFIPHREVIVTVVDQVKTNQPNQLTLHRKAFEALDVSPTVGVINVEITPIYEEV